MSYNRHCFRVQYALRWLPTGLCRRLVVAGGGLLGDEDLPDAAWHLVGGHPRPVLGPDHGEVALRGLSPVLGGLQFALEPADSAQVLLRDALLQKELGKLYIFKKKKKTILIEFGVFMPN